MKNVNVSNLKIKTNPKGNIIKLIKTNKKNKFGELYVSIIKKKKIKGWKLNTKKKINLIIKKKKKKFIN